VGEKESSKEKKKGFLGKIKKFQSSLEEKSLIKQLTSENPELREQAVVSLAKNEKLDYEAMMSLYSLALEDDEPIVRLAAIESARDIDRFSTIELLIPFLGDSDEEVRNRTEEFLVGIGHNAVVILVKASKEKDYEYMVRASLARIFGRIGIEFLVLEPLIDALEDENYLVRYEVINALGKIPDPKSILPLVKSVSMIQPREGEEEKIDNYWEAVKNLVKFGDEGIKDLSAVIRDETSSRECGLALEVLYRIRSPDSVEALAAGLEVSDKELRKETISYLTEIGTPRAIELMLSATRDEDEDILTAVLSCLRGISGFQPEVASILFSALGTQNLIVRYEANCIMREIIINETKAVADFVDKNPGTLKGKALVNFIEAVGYIHRDNRIELNPFLRATLYDRNIEEDTRKLIESIL
jgi:HEAT repeat protein